MTIRIHEKPTFGVSGHLLIQDDLGNTIVDKKNAIHPQNMARILSRALANEPNSGIHRLAYGNGGTEIDAASTVTYREPRDGYTPDPNTWDSRLYNETYSEIVDESSPDLGTDVGSPGRTGGGSDAAGDPPSTEHISGPGVVSNELGIRSEVVVTSVLNAGEPSGQFETDDQSPSGTTNTSFEFDEIGLYADGAPASSTNGYHNVYVGDRHSADASGLAPTTAYDFQIEVDGTGVITVSFTTPASGSGATNEITFGDVCEAINTNDAGWSFTWSSGAPTTTALPQGAVCLITDFEQGTYPTTSGEQTFGFLQFKSVNVGSTSTVEVQAGTTNDMLADMNQPSGGILQTPVAGEDAGVQNDPLDSGIRERERLLTHVIFSPVLKAANRSLTIVYTLTLTVAFTPWRTNYGLPEPVI